MSRERAVPAKKTIFSVSPDLSRHFMPFTLSPACAGRDPSWRRAGGVGGLRELNKALVGAGRPYGSPSRPTHLRVLLAREVVVALPLAALCDLGEERRSRLRRLRAARAERRAHALGDLLGDGDVVQHAQVERARALAGDREEVHLPLWLLLLLL